MKNDKREEPKEPRCSNCPRKDDCPWGRQLCDHTCCSLHPGNDAYFKRCWTAYWRNAEEDFENGDN